MIRQMLLRVVASAMVVVAVGAQQFPMPEDAGMASVQRWGVRLPGWRARMEQPGVSVRELFFRGMNGGLHITAQQPAVLWSAQRRPAPAYVVSASFALLERPDVAQSYGVFIAGTRLADSRGSYISLTVNRLGEVAVTRHSQGAEIPLLRRVTSPAVNRPDERGDIANQLAIRVDGAVFTCLVNDQEVFSGVVTKSEGEGTAGIRVGGGVDAHLYYFRIDPQ